MRIIPLESNPKTFNALFNRLGFEGAEFHELLGFEPDLIEFVPRPHLALIFCYPYKAEAFEYRRNIYAKLVTSDAGTVPEWAHFSIQHDGNSCGYYAMFHAVMNNLNSIKISNDGLLARYFRMRKKVQNKESESSDPSGSSSSDQNENSSTLLTQIFNAISLNESETDVPVKVNYHFIAYLHHDGHLFEFDSLQQFPRDCGPSTEETFLEDAGKVCMELANHLGSCTCNAIALCATEN